MSATSNVVPAKKNSALQAILWGGVIAGILDISVAFIRWGHPVRLLQGIAGGLLGRAASLQGGMATATLGLAFHFSIAFSAASVYYLASRKLVFLHERPVVWGLFYGVAVYMFMSWVVVPLSALPKSTAPFSMTSLVLSLLTHMFCVGLPIALANRRYA